MSAQDKWDVKVVETAEKAWAEKTDVEKVMTVVIMVTKGLCVSLLLYLFIISLGLMGNAFKILGGKTAGKTFRENELFDNPIAGLVMGVLATVLVQSSSTSTSIVITMTAAGLMEVKNAIPMIMGANIGTSVTNTIVSLAQMGDKDEYRRAFAGATVHDCFNLLTVAILLPIEAIFGLLRNLSSGIANATFEEDTEKAQKQDFLKKITKPISSRIVQVDKKIITNAAKVKTQAELDEVMESSMIVLSRTKDNHLFMDTPMSDGAAGWLLLIVSLLFLTTCLSLLVKVLQSIFRGRAAIWMQSILNLEFNSVPFVGDCVLLLFGVVITILMQSSSITTSTLTPLVGVGLIRLDKMFPFTVGANIGTTITGILSALASSNIKTGMTVALSHLFFNLIGTLLWFPLPFMRRVPLAMARFLGSMAADLRWFPIAYIFVVFGVLPALLFALSLAGVGACVVGVIFLLVIFLIPLAIHILRQTNPTLLPLSLQENPAWLPESLCVVDSQAEVSEGKRGPVQYGGGNADMDGARIWWQAPFVWGLGWFMLMLLVVAFPNAQWANMKYAKFDKREHVGIGAWSACSKQYLKAMEWSSAPGCSSQEAQTCFQWKMGSCGVDGFADADGANSAYEKSWENCTTQFQCTPMDWETACVGGGCGGSMHADQCKNLTKAVTFHFTTSYAKGGSSAKAWVEGEYCRPLGDICDNSDAVGDSGNLAVVGFVFGCIGQLLLLAYVFQRQQRDMARVLLASILFLFLTWVMLLASWASFATVINSEATCVIVDVTTRKAAMATGTFGDMINNSGSYSYGCVIVAWILLIPMLALMAQRAHADTHAPAAAAMAETKLQASADAPLTTAPHGHVIAGSQGEGEIDMEDDIFELEEPPLTTTLNATGTEFSGVVPPERIGRGDNDDVMSRVRSKSTQTDAVPMGRCLCFPFF